MSASARRLGLVAAITATLAATVAAWPCAAQDAEPTIGPEGYAAGVAAMQAKDTKAAIAAFGRCLAEQPRNADCEWELGWAYWTTGDWKAVVQHWEVVAAVDPARDGLEKYLAQARDNVGLDTLLAKGRAAADKTYQSDAPAGTTLRVRAVGDMMIGTTFPEGNLPPDDAKSMFADVADWLRDADLTFGNLEGPLCDSGKTDKCKPDAAPGSCYAFRSPGRYAPLYKAAGFDMVSTANNHAGDFGEGCRLETEKNLDAQGIGHSGRPGDIATATINGLKVAMIGFHTSRATHYVNDHDQAAALVRALAADNDIVIVSFHGGAEGSKAIHVPVGGEKFYGENRGDLREFARVVVAAGADLVLGHGPHVLRGMEIIDDRLVAYSLGNFATYGRFNVKGTAGVGAVLDVTLASDGRFVSGRILPTRQEGEGVPFKDDLASGGKAQAIDLVRTLSEEDFPEHGVKVAQDGSIGRR